MILNLLLCIIVESGYLVSCCDVHICFTSGISFTIGVNTEKLGCHIYFRLRVT